MSGASVTAEDLAARLGTSGKHCAPGYAMKRLTTTRCSAGTMHGDNWVFTSDQADQLAAEYRRRGTGV